MIVVRQNKKTKKQEFLGSEKGNSGQRKWYANPFKATTGYSRANAKSLIQFEISESALAEHNNATYRYSVKESEKFLDDWWARQILDDWWARQKFTN